MDVNLKQINILSLPVRIKLKLLKHLHQSYKIKIVGHKRIQTNHLVTIIELSNSTRIWTLFGEIDKI